MLGSCFSDYIGAKLRNSLWPVTINPFGTLFNPMSIANSIDIALGERKIRIENIEGKCIPWDFSTAFEGTDYQEVDAVCRQQAELLKAAIQRAEVLMITFGTSIVYELHSDKETVANCHKLPQNNFHRRVLSIREISNRWNETIEKIRKVNPNIKLILSVSPVRHLADGFAENNRSKARLLLACENIISRDVCYFPSYELVCDDLRDYRFYAQDLVHPSAMAVDYIWDKFCESALDAEGKGRIKEGEKLSARLSHRFINPESEESKAFIKKTQEMIDRFTATTDEETIKNFIKEMAKSHDKC